MHTFTESIVEEATLTRFEELGYSVVNGPDITPGEPGAERASYAEVVLVGRLRAALARLNPHRLLAHISAETGWSSMP